MSRQNIILIISLVCFCIVLCIKVISDTQLNSLNKTYNEKTDLINKVKHFKQNKEKLLGIKKEVYKQKSTSQLITELIQDLQKCGLNLLIIKPKEKEQIKDLPGISLYPLSIKCKGPFNNIYKFMHKIENYTYFIIPHFIMTEKIDERSVEMELNIKIPLKAVNE